MGAKELKVLVSQYETIISQIARRLRVERTPEDLDMLNHYRNRYFKAKQELEEYRINLRE